MESNILIKPIGIVVDKDKIEVFEEYMLAMDGLSEDMLIWVLYVFHLGDEKLKVHPKGDPTKPLRGVFSTRSPDRVNRIALSAVRIKKIEGNHIIVDDLDAFVGSPVIDIKPYSEFYDVPSGSVLNAKDILKRIENERLISDFVDLALQIQPNGFDFTLREIGRLKGAGRIDFDNTERSLPEVELLEFDENGWLYLKPGIYRAYLNEIVRLSEDLMAIGRPRSTILRAGANILTAVWDAGYVGRSEVGLVVYNPDGIWVKKNARILQLVFIKLTSKTKSYSGKYKGENI
jgi:dUTP pyrophosphatase